jgi:cytochrome c oxidase cbb3-type subunit 2
MIEWARKDVVAQASGEERTDTSGLQDRYGEAAFGHAVNARDFDGHPEIISEMDALVAYLQVLGTMVDFEKAEKVEDGAE